MKKFLTVSVAAMIAATPAFASPATDSFDINATVADTCTMENVNDINLGQLTIDTTAGSGALLISAAAYAQSGAFWLSCNETNRMSLVPTEGRLVNLDRSMQSGDDSSFTDRINYQVAAINYQNSNPQPRYNSVGGAQFQNNSRGAIHRTVNMAAYIAPGENLLRPLAGTYRDTVTVTVTII